MNDEFGLRLILSEEERQGVSGGTTPTTDTAGKTTYVYDESGKSASSTFDLSPENTGMEVPGPGEVDTILAIADSDSFHVAVTTDDATLVDGNFATLKDNSAELSHVAAYERGDDGKQVLSISEFHYRGRVTATISPTEPVTFDTLRAVYTLNEGVDVDED